MMERKCGCSFDGENREERDPLEDLGVDGSIILKFVFKIWIGEAWTGLIGTVVGLL